MEFVLPLDKMTAEDRLAAMERLWEDLCRSLESLHLYAGIHSLHFGCHRLLAKRFPFAIYYGIQ